MSEGREIDQRTIWERYQSKELTWGEAWNAVIGEVIKETKGGFSLSRLDGELVSLYGTLKVGSGLRERLGSLINQAKKLLREPGHEPDKV